MKRLICFLIGHKWQDQIAMDEGVICLRCYKVWKFENWLLLFGKKHK